MSSTQLQYGRIVERFFKEYDRDTGRAWTEDPVAFASWFGKRSGRGDWGRRTFWIYRAAVIRFMAENGPAEAMQVLRSIQVSLRKKGTETSSKKMKKLPEKEWQALADTLIRSDNPLDIVIYHWLDAGRYTGLRPCEWEHAYLESGAQVSLVVANAKRSEVRANGVMRRVMFSPEHNQVEISAIRMFLRDIATLTGRGLSFRTLYTQCRKRLEYIRRAKTTGIDPENGQGITLYSPRHQFAADMKASGLSKAQIAALMGHASEDSATIHYARKRDGQKRVPPTSPASEIASVRAGQAVAATEGGKKVPKIIIQR